MGGGQKSTACPSFVKPYFEVEFKSTSNNTYTITLPKKLLNNTWYWYVLEPKIIPSELSVIIDLYPIIELYGTIQGQTLDYITNHISTLCKGEITSGIPHITSIQDVSNDTVYWSFKNNQTQLNIQCVDGGCTIDTNCQYVFKVYEYQ